MSVGLGGGELKGPVITSATISDKILLGDRFVISPEAFEMGTSGFSHLVIIPTVFFFFVSFFHLLG